MILFLVVVLLNFVYSSHCDLLNSTEGESPQTTQNLELLQIAPTIRPEKRFRSKDNFLHDRYIGPKLLDMNLDYCRRPAKCQILNYTTCMGLKLPYHSTSLNLTDSSTQEKVQEKLQLYQYLRYMPKCWAVVQPFLCALYMPKCENDEVDLPSREMCKITLGPCKILYNNGVFPGFMQCDDKELFPSKCKNDIHELKFNNTGLCMEPLVRTDQQDWFYPDVEGCGLQCKNTMYTESEIDQIHNLIASCTVACMVATLFTIITFVIDWKTAKKYPALAIFYTNVCFFISYCGWFVQFLSSETRDDVVCKKDGTLRKFEPSASENLSCVIVFVMVYYFLIAGMVWFVIFTYAWHRSSLQALGKIQERVDKKRAYFHLVAWSLPLILTITTMALGEIDGDYITGVCFVGFVSAPARIGLLLVPLAAAIIVSVYILSRGLILLVRVKIESREIISEHSSSKIRSNIVRMSFFSAYMAVIYSITFIYHVYVFINSKTWENSLHDYILCKLTSLSSDFSHCKLESRPSVAMRQLQLLAVFGAGIGMSSWIWCTPTLHVWKRYFRRLFHCEIQEPMKLQKHKIIAQAFAKRKKFNNGGRISIDCQNRTDPVGLHFDLNSAPSNELTTSWAANLPRLVNRRGALASEATCSFSSNNQSIDSEMSVSVRHVSIESRRNSGDSQLSVQVAELTAVRKVNSRRHASRMKRKRDFTHGSRDFMHNLCRHSKTGTKRGSSTSVESHLGAQILNVLTNTSDTKNIAPNLKKRRAGITVQDGQHISNLLSKGKLVIPYNFKSGSEDENMSVTISESKFNVVINKNSTNNLDLNDQVMKSLRQSLLIEELNSSTDSSSKTNTKDFKKEKRYSRSDRESRLSKRSKHSRKSKIKSELSSDSDSYANKSGHSYNSSSCPELKQLVQSSLNSGTSLGTQNNRSSKQSKTSIDVGVQANAREIATQTAAFDKETENLKNKKAKINEKKKMKDKYKHLGNTEELASLKQFS